MYEMKGALPGHAASEAPSCLASPAPRATPPVPGARTNPRFPGSSYVPGLPPDGARFQR